MHIFIISFLAFFIITPLLISIVDIIVNWRAIIALFILDKNIDQMIYIKPHKHKHVLIYRDYCIKYVFTNEKAHSDSFFLISKHGDSVYFKSFSSCFLSKTFLKKKHDDFISKVAQKINKNESYILEDEKPNPI